MRLHFLYGHSIANGNAVTAVIVSNRLVVHLTLQSPNCRVCTTAQHGSTHCCCVLFYVHELKDGKVPSEATLLSCLPIALCNDIHVDSTKLKVERK